MHLAREPGWPYATTVMGKLRAQEPGSSRAGNRLNPADEEAQSQLAGCMAAGLGPLPNNPSEHLLLVPRKGRGTALNAEPSAHRTEAGPDVEKSGGPVKVPPSFARSRNLTVWAKRQL